MTDEYAAVTGTDTDTTLRFERDYATSPEDLWSAITTPDRLSRWLDNVDGDLQEGGRVVVHLDDGDATFVVDRCQPPSSLAVRWTGDTGDTGDTTVQVEVTAVEGGHSRLVLVHEGLGAAAAQDHAVGWHWHLAALTGEAEQTDVDLPDWDELAQQYRDGAGQA